MKQLIILMLTIAFTSNAMAQQSTVIYADSLTKSELFGNAQSFFTYYFKSANHVIQLSDPVNGRIVRKGIVNDRNVTITYY